MSLHTRLEALQTRHTSLEAQISDEDRRPQPNGNKLAKLKVQKLQVKDEIERIRSTLH